MGVGETDAAATGTVDEPVGLGEADEVAEEVGRHRPGDVREQALATLMSGRLRKRLA